MRTYFYLFANLLLFTNCGDNTPQPEPKVIDDSYFKGRMGRIIGELINPPSRIKNKIIWTMATDPKYTFVFEDGSHGIRNSFGLLYYNRAEFGIPYPQVGKVYESGISEQSKSFDFRYIYTKDPKDAENIETIYKADAKRIALKLEVLKKEPIDVLEVSVKGYIYNELDSTDSLEVDAKFRTRPH